MLRISTCLENEIHRFCSLNGEAHRYSAATASKLGHYDRRRPVLQTVLAIECDNQPRPGFAAPLVWSSCGNLNLTFMPCSSLSKQPLVTLAPSPRRAYSRRES